MQGRTATSLAAAKDWDRKLWRAAWVRKGGDQRRPVQNLLPQICVRFDAPVCADVSKLRRSKWPARGKPVSYAAANGLLTAYVRHGTARRPKGLGSTEGLRTGARARDALRCTRGGAKAGGNGARDAPHHAGGGGPRHVGLRIIRFILLRSTSGNLPGPRVPRGGHATALAERAATEYVTSQKRSVFTTSSKFAAYVSNIPEPWLSSSLSIFFLSVRL